MFEANIAALALELGERPVGIFVDNLDYLYEVAVLEAQLARFPHMLEQSGHFGSLFVSDCNNNNNKNRFDKTNEYVVEIDAHTHIQL